MSKAVHFVLVRPQFAGNAGASARALLNTGFQHLVLVNPAFLKTAEEALQFAVGAKSLLINAPVFTNLAEAVQNYPVVIGASRRQGGYRKNILNLFELPSWIENLPQKGDVAILFGHEANGLSNAELDHCQAIVQIPSSTELESFNLSQAVLLVVYELFRHQKPVIQKPDSEYPTRQELEGMYEHLFDTLEQIGFLRKSSPYHIPRILRNLFSRAHLTEPEVRIIRGICRQILWYQNQKASCS